MSESTEQTLPPPINGTDCDLRGIPYMPLHLDQFLGSDFNLLANDAEFRAGLTLFCVAWKQVPAGSLPRDDAALCRLAGFGREVTKWNEVKAMALRNWTLCSDGRLHHRYLAELAQGAMKTRQAARARKAAWKEKKNLQKAAIYVTREIEELMEAAAADQA